MNENILESSGIYYRKNDFKSDRQTLVFVHGISGSSSAWLPYEKKFESQYNILTFDLRGHGKSWKSKGIENYSIEKFSNDLFELVSFLDLEKFILISHSFGVLVALDFISHHMEMIEKLVFLSPNFAPKKITSSKLIKPFLSMVKVFKYLPFKQEARGHVDYSRFKNTGDWNIPRMFADIKTTSLRVYLYGTKKSLEVDYEKVIDNIGVPTLIMHGKKDTIFPVEQSYLIHKKIKNSQLIILENSDHILVLNNFLEVSKSIDDFIDRSSS